MTESLAIIPRSVEELETLAERLAKSTLLPAAMRDKMPNVLVTIMAGQEMGLAPMAALRSIHVIEGKPVMAADAMVAVVLGSGKAEYFSPVEETDESATWETKRVGDPHPRRCTWTMAMAKKASLSTKDNWRGYPRAMLGARAKSELARKIYPDVLAGVFTRDEVDNGHESSAPPTRYPDAIDAEVIAETADARKTLPWWVVEIERCETQTELEVVAVKLSKLPESDKSEAKKRYAARLGWIRKHTPPAPPNPQDYIETAEYIDDPTPPSSLPGKPAAPEEPNEEPKP